jgi:beta-glucosidase
MGAYNRTNGEPCCASKPLLQEILRDKLGFEGYVVSDCGAIRNIWEDHKVVETATEAAALAINAGCDLFCHMQHANIRKKRGYWQWIKNAVDNNLLTEDTIDISVTRLFMARFKLGMFDPPEIVQYQQIPFEVNDCKEHRRLALKAAQESIVLLKNANTIIPLSKDIKAIAVIGPNADDLPVLLGNYNSQPSRHTTFLQGIKEKVSSESKVFYAEGCDLTNKSKEGFDEAKEIAIKSDIIIMVLGISAEYESEEGNARRSEAGGDRVHLDLPGVQKDLLKEIHEIGKPIVLILTSGSALSVNYAKENIPAIVQAWYPGEEGGAAVADVIFGDYNPAGRLPVTFYKSVDQLPPFEDYRMERRTYRYFKGESLYSFGYGLSYTRFKYSNLQLSSKKVKTNEILSLSVDIENVGGIDGDEVVQLYISNTSSSLNLPLRELQGFKRITLEKGKKKTVSFIITPKNISHVNNDGKRNNEPGKFQISVGGCQPGYSEDGVNIVEGFFEVSGEKIEIK